jgi:hypothetical protein
VHSAMMHRPMAATVLVPGQRKTTGRGVGLGGLHRLRSQLGLRWAAWLIRSDGLEKSWP